jgi:biotin carboxylase
VKDHILIINRWGKPHGEYHRYFDHAEIAVSYVSTAAVAGVLDPELAEHIALVSDLDDLDEVRTAIAGLIERYGAFTRLVAGSEFNMDVAGKMRDEFGIAGRSAAATLLVRDKVTMKNAVASAGVPVPMFRVVDDADELRAYAAEFGYPFICKPRRGMDSVGVSLVDSPEVLAEVAQRDLTDHECEQYITGELYHVDGIVSGGEVLVQRPSRYLSSCLDLALGVADGGIVDDDAKLHARVDDMLAKVLPALGIANDAFHLELFRTPDDELIFLEIAARPGGGPIPESWHEVYGIDLVEASIRMQMGLPVRPAPEELADAVAGNLLMPLPPERPCRVVSVSSLAGLVEGLYAEKLPEVGAVLDGHGGSFNTAGTYRFRGRTTAQVLAAINRAQELYRLDTEPV